MTNAYRQRLQRSLRLMYTAWKAGDMHEAQYIFCSLPRDVQAVLAIGMYVGRLRR